MKTSIDTREASPLLCEDSALLARAAHEVLAFIAATTTDPETARFASASMQQFAQPVVDPDLEPAPAESGSTIGVYRIFKRLSTQEWVLELTGSINDTYFVTRHTEPSTTELEEVPGLPSLYAAVAMAERDPRPVDYGSADDLVYFSRHKNSTAWYLRTGSTLEIESRYPELYDIRAFIPVAAAEQGAAAVVSPGAGDTA